MTNKERVEWLLQINRIHEAERRQRFADSQEELERMLQMRIDMEE